MIGKPELMALAPLITLASTAVAVMLAIAIRRHHASVHRLTVFGIMVSLAFVALEAGRAPLAVTPLFRVDRYALCFTGMSVAAAWAVVLLGRNYFRVREEEPEELYLLVLTTLIGAGVLAAGNHFASFFLGLETLSVSLIALIAYPYRREPRALEAGMKYLVLSGVSSGFLLFGMALIYMEAGTLEFARLGDVPVSLPSMVGTLLIVAAVGFKLSLVPFHLWTADVYQGAPAPVTALLATVSKGAFFVLLLRYVLATGGLRSPALVMALSILAGASMVVGNLLALRQQNVKRILAYSSIAHMGYLSVVLLAASHVGPDFAAEALMFYLLAYFATTLAAFGVITVLSPADREAEDLEDFSGLFQTRPWLSVIFTIALLSLAGIPLTAGFVAKFYLFSAGGQGSLWALLGLLIVGSGLGLYYYLRVVLTLAKVSAGAPSESTVPIPFEAHLALAVLLLLVLGLGIAPGFVMGLLNPLLLALR